MEKRRLTEPETTRLLEASSGDRVLSLGWGVSAVWLEAVEGNAWAFELLDAEEAV